MDLYFTVPYFFILLAPQDKQDKLKAFVAFDRKIFEYPCHVVVDNLPLLGQNQRPTQTKRSLDFFFFLNILLIYSIAPTQAMLPIAWMHEMKINPDYS
jgi:hypothetical protein